MNVDFGTADWTAAGIQSLRDKCTYLIKERGFESWPLMPSSLSPRGTGCFGLRKKFPISAACRTDGHEGGGVPPPISWTRD
jgi:hypothetical protein